MNRWWVFVLIAAGCGEPPPVVRPTRPETDAIPTAPAVDDPIARLQAALREKNPDYKPELGRYEPASGTPTAAEFPAAGLRDLTPFVGTQFVYLAFLNNPVQDLAPLAGLPLEELYLEGTAVVDLRPLTAVRLRSLWLNKTAVADLSPLDGMPLTQLNLLGTKVTDVSPLRGMPLETLWLNETGVADLTPLADCPLQSLTLHQTAVKDIAIARRWPTLQRLHLGETQVTDLRPLEGLRLTRLIVTPQRILHGWDVIRRMDTLTELDIEFREPQRWTPAEFSILPGAVEIIVRKPN